MEVKGRKETPTSLSTPRPASAAKRPTPAGTNASNASLILSLVIGLMAGVGTLFQPPYPDTWLTPNFPSADWWLYPVEEYPQKRLPTFVRDLNAVTVADNGNLIWAVGDEGTILGSREPKSGPHQGPFRAAE